VTHVWSIRLGEAVETYYSPEKKLSRNPPDRTQQEALRRTEGLDDVIGCPEGLFMTLPK
jgi:hypothetical protein